MEQSVLPVGGRLRYFWTKCRDLGAPKSVVRVLRRGYALPFVRVQGRLHERDLSPVCPAYLATTYSQGSDLEAAMQAKVSELLRRKAIAVVPPGTKGFFNRFPRS